MIFSMILGFALTYYYNESKKWFYSHSALVGVAIGVIGGLGWPISFPFWWILSGGPPPQYSYELLFLFYQTGIMIIDYTPLIPVIITIGINVASSLVGTFIAIRFFRRNAVTSHCVNDLFYSN